MPGAAYAQAAEPIEAVHELTGGRGADVVVKWAGVPEVFPEGQAMRRTTPAATAFPHLEGES